MSFYLPTVCAVSASLFRNRQEQLELGRQLLLAVQAVGEVQAADAAVRVELHAKHLDVISSVRAAGEVRQVKLNLIPALV